jgi:hypothetical protein
MIKRSCECFVHMWMCAWMYKYTSINMQLYVWCIYLYSIKLGVFESNHPAAPLIIYIYISADRWIPVLSPMSQGPLVWGLKGQIQGLQEPVLPLPDNDDVYLE